MTTALFQSATPILFAASSLAVAMTGTPAYATPITYLDCQMPSDDGPRVAQLALDEDGREVIYQLPAEKVTHRLPAVFSSNNVTFKLKDKAQEITFSVNRLDLSVQRYVQNGIERSPPMSGSCSETTRP